MAKHTFDEVSTSPSFPQEEEKVLKNWNKIGAYEECLKQAEGEKFS
jgi:hypothetical protein